MILDYVFVGSSICGAALLPLRTELYGGVIYAQPGQFLFEIRKCFSNHFALLKIMNICPCCKESQQHARQPAGERGDLSSFLSPRETHLKCWIHFWAPSEGPQTLLNAWSI